MSGWHDRGMTAAPPPAEPDSPSTSAAADRPEDPHLAAAVADVETFAAGAGWDRPTQLFALVATADLIGAEPALAAQLAGDGRWTAVAQDNLPAGDLAAALAGIGWPAEVAGAVLVQEIVVLPPSVGPLEELTPEQAAAHPERAEARLVAGVLRDLPGGSCLLRMRSGEYDLIRGADLAPGLLGALAETFAD